MTTVQCRRCSTSFETAARLGGRTSCPNCRAAVYVPKTQRHGGTEFVLLLDCEHADIYCGDAIRDVPSDEVAEHLWPCSECGGARRKARALVAVLSTEELFNADTAADARLELAIHTALDASGALRGST